MVGLVWFSVVSLANSGESPTSAAAETSSPATRAAACAPFLPEPSDPWPTDQIRSRSHPLRATRSRSNGPRAWIPVRPGKFVKEPLSFLRINPRSKSVQKYFQFGPVLALRPLRFPVLETAVQPWCFCTLDPRTKV